MATSRTVMGATTTVRWRPTTPASAAAVEGTNPVSSPDAVLPYSHGQADTLTSVGADEHGREFSAAYNANQTGVPPTDINGRTIARDDYDRIQHDDKLTYTYDALGRLALVERDGDEELRVVYDGAGRRRLERRREPKEGMLDLVLEYEGANVVEENKATAPGTIVFQTVHGPGEDVPLVTIPGPLESGGKAPIMLGSNVRGDVVMAFDLEDLKIVEEQQLDDYGERETDGCIEGKEDGVASLPVASCSLGYLGRYGIAGARQHMGTKLVDLRNRVYATHLRGFLTKDPMGNVDSEGRWNYVAADPVNLRDPWGLETDEGAPTGQRDIGKDYDDCGAGDSAACDRLNDACEGGADSPRCGSSNSERTTIRRYKAGFKPPPACGGGACPVPLVVAAATAVAVVEGVAGAGASAGVAASAGMTAGAGNVVGTSLPWTLGSLGVGAGAAGGGAGVVLPLLITGGLVLVFPDHEYGRRPPREEKKRDTRVAPYGDPAPQLPPAGFPDPAGDPMFDPLDHGGDRIEASEAPRYKIPRPRVSGKEGAKDVPSWAEGNRPLVGEAGKDFANRLLDGKYGKDGWEGTGPGSEHNKIKKWGNRGFIDPP